MSSPVPSLKTLVAQSLSTATTAPAIQLPPELITYVNNYVNLQIVLTEIPRIWDDLELLRTQIQAAAQLADDAPVDQGVLAAFLSDAQHLQERMATVLASFNDAFNAVEQEENAEWRAYYTQILTADIDTITVLQGQTAAIINTVQYFL
jgi:hypothetical protein